MSQYRKITPLAASGHATRHSRQGHPVGKKSKESWGSKTRHRVPTLTRVVAKGATTGVSAVSDIVEAIRKVSSIDLSPSINGLFAVCR